MPRPCSPIRNRSDPATCKPEACSVEGLMPGQPLLRLRVSGGRGQASAAKVKNHSSQINRPFAAPEPLSCISYNTWLLSPWHRCLPVYFPPPGICKARRTRITPWALKKSMWAWAAGGREPQMILPGSHPLVAPSRSLLPSHRPGDGRAALEFSCPDMSTHLLLQVLVTQPGPIWAFWQRASQLECW